MESEPMTDLQKMLFLIGRLRNEIGHGYADTILLAIEMLARSCLFDGGPGLTHIGPMSFVFSGVAVPPGREVSLTTVFATDGNTQHVGLASLPDLEELFLPAYRCDPGHEIPGLLRHP